MGGVSGKGTTDDPDLLPDMEEADADQVVDVRVCGSHRRTVNLNAERPRSDGLGRQDVSTGYIIRLNGS